MSSIYLPEELKARLIRAARRRGFQVERGRQSQLAEYIAYLVESDERAGRARGKRNTLALASGLLIQPGRAAPSEAEVDAWLDERRTRK
ncbi:MAG: hypothetical protein IT318_08540 [Anaerolineales bacterium]|nr:hypothetical protein [Anaerolineales bacterium]